LTSERAGNIPNTATSYYKARDWQGGLSDYRANHWKYAKSADRLPPDKSLRDDSIMVSGKRITRLCEMDFGIEHHKSKPYPPNDCCRAHGRYCGSKSLDSFGRELEVASPEMVH
jgi:hypothetical protein